MTPYSRDPSNLKNHTLMGSTYLYSPYMGVPPPPPGAWCWPKGSQPLVDFGDKNDTTCDRWALSIEILIKLVINRWAWALVPQVWWSRATHSREGGIHGNTEAATTHLGTVTLKDSVEYLPTHNETLTSTQGRVGAKTAKLASNVLAKWALRMIARCKLRVGVMRSPCKGPGPPQALCGEREWATAYKHHKVSLQTAKGANEFPASQGCRRAFLQGLLCLNYI